MRERRLYFSVEKVKKRMNKISTIFTLFLMWILCLNTACVNKTYTASTTPQTLIGKIEPTSRIFSHSIFSAQDSKPYDYAFYNTDGDFVAYVDLDNVVSPSFDNVVSRPIIARGTLEESPRGMIFRIDYITISR